MGSEKASQAIAACYCAPDYWRPETAARGGEETRDHRAVFFGNLHKLDVDYGPILRFHNRVNHDHALILQNKNRRPDDLPFIKHVEVVRANEARPSYVDLLDHWIDIDTVHAE